MKTSQAASIIFTILSSILALIAIATDEWTSSEQGEMTSGLFKPCKDPICNNFTTIAVTTSALFVSGIIELLFGSILIFIGWNKGKAIFENLGLFLLLVGTIQFSCGSTLFTTFYFSSQAETSDWELSFILTWGATGAAVLASFLALCTFFKQHRVTVTILSKEKTKTPKINFIKEARV